MLIFAEILYAIGFVAQALACVFYDTFWAHHVFWFGLTISFWGFSSVISQIIDIQKEINKLKQTKGGK